MKYRLATLAALAAAVTTLSACGSSSSQSPSSASSSATATAHNAADVAFATDMIPHHSQAVEMADMALTKATNADVKSLATKIKAAQDPEIITMTGWLKGWSEPVPASSMSMSGMGEASAMGMMSDAEMATLDKATGVEFDRMWVKMMITHHQGAVDMSKTELAGGQYTGAKALAQSIITSQTAQISQLQALEKQLA
jgi:uncharacterized protein (DUF305 family)